MESSVWNGGTLLLGGFDSNNKLAFFNGSAMAATIESTETQPYEDRLAQILDCRPLIDGGVPSVSIAVRNRLVDTPVYNIPTPMNGIGTCPQIASGRYVRASVTIPANSSWTHFQGMDISAIPNGVM
jgi:hypothetical protein